MKESIKLAVEADIIKEFKKEAKENLIPQFKFFVVVWEQYKEYKQLKSILKLYKHDGSEESKNFIKVFNKIYAEIWK